MGRRTYLSPQFRNVRTEQIGPSSHKNEYRAGVLVGNWQEARVDATDLGAGGVATSILAVGSVAAAPFKPTTTYGSDFAHGSTPSVRGMIRAPDLAKELLLGQSSGRTLGQANHSAMPQKHIAKLHKVGTDAAAVLGASNPFVTTKMASHDALAQERSVATGAGSISASAAMPPVQTRDKFTRTFVAEHNQVGLRRPEELKLTPLVRK